MRVLATITALATLTAAGAAAFSVPADDARWTVRPRYLRALDRVHGAGCVAGASGLRLAAGVRAELLFNGTQLRLIGIAPPGTAHLEILMEGAPLLPPQIPEKLECAPLAEWAALDGARTHNLTIVAPAGIAPGQFLIVNATGTAPDLSSDSESTSPTPLPDSAAQSHSDSSALSDSSPTPKRTPHAALLLAAVLGPLALFLLAGFALYSYRRRSARSSSQGDAHSSLNGDAHSAGQGEVGKGKGAGVKGKGVGRSRSFKGMREAHFVMVPATVRPDTPGVVKV